MYNCRSLILLNIHQQWAYFDIVHLVLNFPDSLQGQSKYASILRFLPKDVANIRKILHTKTILS